MNINFNLVCMLEKNIICDMIKENFKKCKNIFSFKKNFKYLKILLNLLLLVQFCKYFKIN